MFTMVQTTTLHILLTEWKWTEQNKNHLKTETGVHLQQRSEDAMNVPTSCRRRPHNRSLVSLSTHYIRKIVTSNSTVPEVSDNPFLSLMGAMKLRNIRSLFQLEWHHAPRLCSWDCCSKERYKDLLVHLRQVIHRKSREFWGTRNWILVHENTLVHRSLLMQQQLFKQGSVVLPHPQHSHDIAQGHRYVLQHAKSCSGMGL